MTLYILFNATINKKYFFSYVIVVVTYINFIYDKIME